MDKTPLLGNEEKIESDSKATLEELFLLEKQRVRKNTAMRKLLLVSIICILFMSIELAGGLYAHSLAILTDAAHLLSDLLGYVISIFSVWLSARPASGIMTFGFQRAEVIGAMASVILIWGLTIWLISEACMRIIDPVEVDGFVMLITSIFGLLCNLVMMKVLHGSGSHHGHSHGHACGGHGAPHDGHDAHEGKHKQEKHPTPPPPPHYVSPHLVEKHRHTHTQEDEVIHRLDEESSSHEAVGEELGTLKPREFLTPLNRIRIHDQHPTPLKFSPELESNKKESLKSSMELIRFRRYSHSHYITSPKIPSLMLHQSMNQSEEHSQEKEEKEHINVRAAFIHILGDILQSIGVIIAALIIYFYPRLTYADPICTLLFSLIVVCTTVNIVKDCIRVLMEGTPEEVNMTTLLSDIEDLDCVNSVHDLHVWSLSVGKRAMSVHLVSRDPAAALREATRICHSSKYKIPHTTIQILNPAQGDSCCKNDMHH